MGYAKVITYGNIVEIYQYENELRPVEERVRRLQVARRNESMALLREDSEQAQKATLRRKDVGRRSQVAFRRLVSANLGESENPILITLTYAENITEIRRTRKDFNAFARNVKNTYGKHVRYVAVSEFQKRGAIHYHTLFWGLPNELVATERHTRMVASLWGQGFVDLKATDGHLKIAGYLAKYMRKAFLDPRLFGLKAYIASRNVKRPIIDKNAIILATEFEHGLSTVEPLHDRQYDTQWLGRCRFRLFDLTNSRKC